MGINRAFEIPRRAVLTWPDESWSVMVYDASITTVEAELDKWGDRRPASWRILRDDEEPPQREPPPVAEPAAPGQPAAPQPDPRIGELMAIIEAQALHMQKLEARFEKLKSELAGV